ncbi:hypothetical protein HMJ29_18600 [Hymenobacter taeanensis]|uniref:Uncharacterized protein n=1 Tax=Hymenobacter taeanensis TaxID=2735321 RepID=A0A6M6BMW8_9BACT|nr:MULTISPECIES: hypothetical protein [Hymenobacter]QJX48813.1 hypothetical protein HMJ29_18600 [Hymenobacter taeanensis]UOQ81679.1 hypothetical protein MUN83_02470 [Hymenobacter sp. 5414T-23]
MKKVLFSAALLLFALSTMAQAPAAKHADRATSKEFKHEGKDEKAHPDNHGQDVQTFAHATALAGSDKGAAISALASNGRSSARGQRLNGSARGNRSQGSNRSAGCGRQGHGQQGGAGHHNGH